MFRSLKFAAVLLVLVILSAPLLAAVTCLGGESPAAMQCPAGCPMMASAGAVPALQIAAHHPGGYCCDVSNAKPSPVVALQAPVTLALAAPQASSAAPGLVPAAVCARRQQPHPVRFLQSAQSLLCTFLI